MKPTNSALNALLASRQFYAVDLFTLTRIDGSALYYCGGDKDIVANGHTYSAGGATGAVWTMQGNPASAKTTIGSATEKLTIDVMPRSATIAGLPFATACRQGVLDGATFQWEIAVMPTYGDVTPGTVIMFVGRVVEVDIGDLTVTLNVNDPRELLDLKMPRNLFAPGCINTLYDTNCTVLQANFATPVTLSGASTTTKLVGIIGAAQADAYFDLGKVKITSGVNIWLWRSIRSWVSPSAVIFPPLPVAPSPGDSAILYPGCDKQATTCNTKFSNLANFRGFPNVPQPETAF